MIEDPTRTAPEAAALWAATLAYGAAHEARLAEGRRLRALDYRGDIATGATYSALLTAEYEAQDALHAAYAAYAAHAGRGGAEENPHSS